MAQKQLLPTAGTGMEEELVTLLSETGDRAYRCVKALENAMADLRALSDSSEKAFMYRDTVIPIMTDLRAACDMLESNTAAEYWPYPTYSELLFGVR